MRWNLSSVLFLLVSLLPFSASADEPLCVERIRAFRDQYSQPNLWGDALHSYVSLLEHRPLIVTGLEEDRPLEALTDTLSSQEPILTPGLRNRMRKGFEPGRSNEPVPEPKEVKVPSEFPVLTLAAFEAEIEPQLARVLAFRDQIIDLYEKSGGSIKEEQLRTFRESVREFRATSDFEAAEANLEYFAKAFEDCEKMKRFLDVPCTDKLPRETYEALFQRWTQFLKILDLDEKAAKKDPDKLGEIAARYFEGIGQFRMISQRIEEAPLFHRREVVSVKRKRKGDVTSISLTVTVKRGEGFAEDRDWVAIRDRMSRLVEEYWSGRKEVSGTRYEVSVKLVEARDPQKPAVVVHRGESNYGLAHVPIGEDKVVLPAQWLDSEQPSPEAQHGIIHEFGHILGFDDAYFFYFNEEDCSVRYHLDRDDIMGNQGELPTLRPDRLRQLVEAYGRKNGRTLNEFWDPFLKLMKEVEKIQESKK